MGFKTDFFCKLFAHTVISSYKAEEIVFFCSNIKSLKSKLFQFVSKWLTVYQVK